PGVPARHRSSAVRGHRVRRRRAGPQAEGDPPSGGPGLRDRALSAPGRAARTGPGSSSAALSGRRTPQRAGGPADRRSAEADAGGSVESGVPAPPSGRRSVRGGRRTVADDAPTIENGAPPAEAGGAPGGSGTPGKRSRRRGEALNTAIFEAVLAELAEVGYARLTMERVAERAKAGKASLYRRWPNRGRLVMDAVYHLMPSPERPADTGSFRGDLLELLRSTSRLLDGPAGEALRGLLSEVLVSPEHGAEIRAVSRGTGVATMRTLAERAAARGEIDPAAITERRLEAGQAMMRHHFLFHGSPVSEAVITGIVDEVVLPLFAAPPPAGGETAD